MRRVAVGVLMFVAIAGCGEQRPPPPPPAPPPSAAVPDGSARAERIRASTPGLVSVEGRNDRPGAVALWHGWFDGPELKLIEERPAGRDAAHPNRYYFEHDRLFYYDGEQQAAADSGATSPAPRATVLAEFGGRQVLRAVRIEHYGAIRLLPGESTAIWTRAAELASAAHDLHAATAVRP